MNKALIIAGPTAVGKTALGIKLAQSLDGEIISGDSMQIYRRLDIGTAKVSEDEKLTVPHHLIDINNVHEGFTAKDFKQHANKLITEISGRNKLPIIVGGTGFYLKALVDNLELGGDFNLDSQRTNLRLSLDNLSEEVLREELLKVDPNSANSIALGGKRRLIRALEVYRLTGNKFSEQPQHAINIDSLVIGLNTERPLLYDRINQRVDQMIDSGLEKEARWLFEQGNELQPQKGIGYREWPLYWNQQISFPELLELIKKDSRNYAKRQLTWFRNKMDTNWFDLILQPDNDQKRMNNLIKEWMNK
ncbi:tRNA (adenosine(37)-N6)-dimethylallyltransferase MiaA [Pediococcus claussenii]|uniref:tRNA dimethylallyltransferase n=1 Tax=Pediococcus claussenii (strain ATCC BAA-344 / DSM 14800 / JCM 18046 / KCTC 3811 / LMG 21948 / P06) TaxID=701521 RepID=G8PDM4_PEDCP|nr:tRNA (adenosine(37)-N6)-dimethylallyltransferase MiaA [Pediococcus claussenii]AEV95359.1 tRNA dimethylallyltransferase [Pediococcus claussenii ATCC BAA-344]ANZ68891.1 tRNA dimethylallyltransferase [Pediococcus claussenii]ANZ70707.1 tRNA dimethylallyltransferase [Pediococcus claussenii]KRN19002.1 miaA protein [Pediococcus claussenii]